MYNVTLVTCLFNIGRGDLQGIFCRPFDYYTTWFGYLLECSVPLVIYCEPSLESLVWKFRDKSNTYIINKDLDYFRKFLFYDDIQRIRNSDYWYDKVSWLKESPQAALELYNPVVMSKQYFMKEVAELNPFNSEYFIWVDAGVANTTPMSLFNEKFLLEIPKYLDKILYLWFPFRQWVGHGFRFSAMDIFAKQEVTRLVRATLFGGPRKEIIEITDLYTNLLGSTLKANNMGTEENILTLISYLEPDKCNLFMLDGSEPRISKFLEIL